MIILKSKLELNQIKKKNDLVKAAYDLFATDGINNTAISDIAKKAGVGKGTFYLYFKDKYDILDQIILKKSTELLEEALFSAKSFEFKDSADALIFVTDYILEYLKRNKVLLRILHKNLSVSLYKRVLKDEKNYRELTQVLELYAAKMHEDYGYSYQESMRLLFIILEMVSSIAYSTIIENEPENIDEIRPLLFLSIRKMIRP